MHIEIWSDFVCPFCYIGKKRFEEALADFPHAEDVTSEFKSFQLDPSSGKYNGESYYTVLAKKFGSEGQARQMTKNIEEQGKMIGLDFNFDIAKPTNTLDAHRLNKYATKNGNTTFQEKLFQAHFINGLDVGDEETLLSLAEKSNLAEKDVKTILTNSDAFKSEVQTDIAEAGQLGVTGVPFFIINRKYAISGAQPKAAFTQALEQVWQEENAVQKFTDLSIDEAGVCKDDHCEVPSDKTK